MIAFFFAATLAAALGGPAVAALPNVAVMDGPVASRWLAAAGVQHAQLTPEQVAADGLGTAQILVLPVDRVRTTAVAQAVLSFVRRGGSVIAVYWGPLVRDGMESTQPSYALIDIVGARPTGWRGTTPITVRGEPAFGASDPARAEFAIPRGILVTLQPAANTQVLARWTSGLTPRGRPAPVPDAAPTPPAGAATGSGATTVSFQDAAIVRLGNVVFTGIDLFAATNDTPAVRQLFYSLFDQFAPNLAFEQARDRASAVMAAVIRTDEQVNQAETQSPNVDFSPVRRLLDQARDAAAQAKQRLGRDRYREAQTAAEAARSYLDQAQQHLQKLSSKSK